jgi:hypothetical protein
MFVIAIGTRIFINEEDTSEEAEVMIGERYKPQTFSRSLFTFETGHLPLETEMFHCSCDVLQCKA